MDIVILGGGGIASQGIVPVVGGEIINRAECDVRYMNDVVRVLATRKPRVVINCAGVSHPGDMKLARFQHEIDVNLIGSFNVAQAALWTGAKTLIFIASVAGMYGKPEHAGYSASKAGVISLVQSLAMEGYDAYAISPGRVDTAMRERDYPGEDKRTRLEPTEIGAVVKDVLDGKYKPGDNIIIRRLGYETIPIKVDRGKWKKWLGVGLPKKF